MSDEKDPLLLMHHMEKIADKRIQDALEKHQLENAHTLTDIHVRLNAISEQIKEMRSFIQSGFPHGDPASHRAVHENYIKEAQQRSEEWQKLKMSILQWGLFGAIGFVALAIWNAIKAEVHK